MITEDQSAVIAFLSDPATHGSVGPVKRIDTHGAVVFLVGDRAYKLKRAVLFDYMDFSTLDKRRTACAAEIVRNSETAPGIYRRAMPIARAAGDGLVLGGEGEPVDWIVEMNRFDEETLLDRIALRGALGGPLMHELARVIVAFHATAERRHDCGGADAMREVVDGDARQLEAFAGRVFSRDRVDRLTGASRAAVAANAALLESRRRAGFVRLCHGDLHLRNIFLWEGRPTLFDAIEFNERIACIDVLYDLAFLLMDLWHRQLEGHANIVLNAYLEGQADLSGLALMPLFLACRAAVRAHVGATAADSQTDAAEAARLRAEAGAYLDLALAFLTPAAPRLVALGGLSGTGKSTLARGLAAGFGPAPGAIVLRSDLVRKELMNVAPEVQLGPDAYVSDVDNRVYEAVRERAAVLLAAGHSVVVDAVHARESERRALERIAAEAGCAFTGLWLEAPAAVLTGRIVGRRGDASDASAAVLRAQVGYQLGTIAWSRVDAAATPGEVVRAARAALAAPR